MNNKQDWCRFIQCKQKKDQKLFWLCVFSTLKKKSRTSDLLEACEGYFT